MLTTTALTNHRVLVTGSDVFGVEGKTVLDSHQWDELNAHNDHAEAHEAFEAAVEAFFEPITKAAEILEQSHAETEDSLFTVQVSEAVEATAGRPAEVIHLHKDTAILRLIDQGDQARLIWVNDQLEILRETPKSTVEFEQADEPEDAVASEPTA